MNIRFEPALDDKRLKFQTAYVEFEGGAARSAIGTCTTDAAVLWPPPEPRNHSAKIVMVLT